MRNVEGCEHQIAENAWLKHPARRNSLQWNRLGPISDDFPSKFLLMVVPGLIASGVVASVLYAVHVSRAPSSSELLTDVTPQGDGLSAEERRGLTRQMLRARRENPQEPAEVRPMLTARPADSGPAEAPAVESKAAAKAAADRTPPDRTPPDHAPQDRTFGAAPLPIARPHPRERVQMRPSSRCRARLPPPPAPLHLRRPPRRNPRPLPLGTTDPASQPPVTSQSPRLGSSLSLSRVVSPRRCFRRCRPWPGRPPMPPATRSTG